MFDLVGISPIQKFNLPQNINSPLHWLNNTILLRNDIKQKFKWAKSSIIVGLAYNSAPDPFLYHPNYMRISKYARLKAYQSVIFKKLRKLINVHFKPQLTESQQDSLKLKIHVDTFPIYEKGYAQTALGGIRGLNNLWHSSLGTYVLLGGVISNVDFNTVQKIVFNKSFFKRVIFSDSPFKAPANAIKHNLCSTCSRCIQACPTSALWPRFQISKCLAFWTTEYKRLIPSNIQKHMQNILFGCDICQDSCLYNQKVNFTLNDQQLHKRFGKVIRQIWHIRELKHMSASGFYKAFKGTPVTRMKFKKFKDRVNYYVHQRELV